MESSKYEQLAMRTEADQVVVLNRVLAGGPNLMRLDNAVRGLCADAGELAGIVQKHIEYGKPLDMVNLKEECGDILWRLAQVCKAAQQLPGGFSLGEVMGGNIHKLEVRYPDKYSDQAANNRDTAAELAAVSGARLPVGSKEITVPYEPVPASNVIIKSGKVVACKHCGMPLLKDNEWMEDGCPCNGPKGCNKEIANTPTETKPWVDPSDVGSPEDQQQRKAALEPVPYSKDGGLPDGTCDLAGKMCETCQEPAEVVVHDTMPSRNAIYSHYFCKKHQRVARVLKPNQS